MYHDRPQANPNANTHNTCSARRQTASVTVCSWAVTGQGQGNNLHTCMHADAHPRCAPACATWLPLLWRPRVAQQLSICQSFRQSRQVRTSCLIVIPAGLGGHRNHGHLTALRLEHCRWVRGMGPSKSQDRPTRPQAGCPPAQPGEIRGPAALWPQPPLLSPVAVDVPTAGPCAVVGSALLSHC